MQFSTFSVSWKFFISLRDLVIHSNGKDEIAVSDTKVRNVLEMKSFVHVWVTFDKSELSCGAMWEISQ